MNEKKVLVVSDNRQIAKIVQDVINSLDIHNVEFDFACSHGSALEKEPIDGQVYMPIDVRNQTDEIINKEYTLVLSAHCKQIFPKQLIDKIRCVNIHPGLNPYNRGMYPHIFSILNGLPTGATLHEMSVDIDRGPVIAQEVVDIDLGDTSESVYNKILNAEHLILEKNMHSLLFGNYISHEILESGNLNTRKDFEQLLEIKLNDKDTFENHLNYLRALSHGERKNSYFINPKNGKRVWVRIILEEE